MVPLVKAISCRVPHSGIRTGTRVSTITVRAKRPAGDAGWEGVLGDCFPMENAAYFELYNRLSAGWQGQEIDFQSEGKIDLGFSDAEALEIRIWQLTK